MLKMVVRSYPSVAPAWITVIDCHRFIKEINVYYIV